MKFNEQTDRMKALIIMGMIHDLAKLSMPKIENINERLKEVGMEIVSSDYVSHIEDKLKDADAIMANQRRIIKNLEHEVSELRAKAVHLKKEVYDLCDQFQTTNDRSDKYLEGIRQSLELVLAHHQFIG